jgi:hypothetical protein
MQEIDFALLAKESARTARRLCGKSGVRAFEWKLDYIRQNSKDILLNQKIYVQYFLRVGRNGNAVVE